MPLPSVASLLAAEKVWLIRILTGDRSGVEIWPELSLGACEDLMREHPVNEPGES